MRLSTASAAGTAMDRLSGGPKSLIHTSNSPNPHGCLRLSHIAAQQTTLEEHPWMGAFLRAPVGLWSVVCGGRLRFFRDGEQVVFSHLHERRSDAKSTP